MWARGRWTFLGSPGDEEFVYLHHDALGSPDVATDEFGQVVNRFSFDPFGAKRGPEWDDDTPYNNLSDVNLGFTGHVGDVDAGLTYMNARMYDPVLGRFSSADTIQPLMSWQHIPEMEDSVKGLRKALRGLNGSLKNPHIGAPEPRVITDAMRRGEQMLLRMEQALAGQL